MKNKYFTFLSLLLGWFFLFTQANAQITVTSSVTDITCTGDCDGAIDITPSGGSGIYTFLWGNAAITEDISNLCAGSYDVTVTEDLSVPFQWFKQNSNGNHTILIPAGSITVDGAVAQSGDVIGVFYDSLGTLACGGYTVFSTGQTAVGAWAKDAGATYGFATGTPGEVFTWKLYQASTNLEIDLVATYNIGGPFTHDSTFAINGMSGILSLVGANPQQSQTHTATVNDPGAVLPTGVITNASTSGGSDGAIDLSVTGGTGTYSYVWSNSAVTEDITGLTAGTYDVTVTDVNSCTGTASFTVTEPSAVSLSASITDATCYGGSNGAIDLTVTGGTPPYTYDWGGGITSEDLSNLSAGTYNVVVTDAGGGVASGSYTVNQAAEIFVAAAVTDVGCNGGSDGAIDVTVTNGVATIAYSWSNTEVTEDLTGIIAGLYALTITDGDGCIESGSWTVTEPVALSLTLTATDASLNGVSDGSIDLTVSGGTTGYTYLWSNTEITEDISGLAAGTYDVTVTDANSCTATGTAQVNEPAPSGFGATGTSTNASCYGICDGSIDVSVTGGVLPYSYIWSHGANTQDVSGLCAGTYTVTVVDGTGASSGIFDWTYTQTADNHTILIPATGITIDGQPPVSGDYFGAFYNLNGGGLACGGYVPYTGSVTAIAAWGTESGLNNGFAASEVFKWKYFRVADGTEIDLTPTYSPPGPGGVVNDSTYTPQGVSQITSFIGISTPPAAAQTDTLTFTITEPTEIVLSGVVTDVTCNLDTDGAVDLSVSGGSSPYTFAWDNSEITEDLTGLAAGTYIVVVTDDIGCTSTMSFIVTEPDAISITGNINFVSCYGLADGAIDVSVSGGTPPYTYAWSNSEITEDLSGLAAGTYTVIVTDNAGCTASNSFTVVEPNELLATAAVTNLLCNNDNSGAIDLSVSGGTLPYTFAWDNSEVTEDLTGLAAGTYNVVVTDDNGCSVSGSYTVTEPTALALSEVIVDVLCNGDLTGSIDITVTGGVAPYTYAWDNSEITEDLAGIAAGTYNVVVSDANGCTIAGSYTVTEPTALAISEVIVDVLCNGDFTGAIDLTVSGGVAPYTFAWDNSEVSEDLTGLAAGTYNVVVTDDNGCTIAGSYTVTEPTVLAVSEVIVDVLCNGNLTGSIDITVTGGVAPYTYAWDNSEVSEDLAGITAGTYNVLITDDNGCTIAGSYTVTEPTALALSEVIDNVLCNGDLNGAIDITVSGGVSPYIYAWDNSEVTEDLTGLAAGNYNVIVTDANGCTIAGSYTVTEPAILALSGNITDILCNGALTGAIDITVTGGTMPYTYTWNNSEVTEDLTGIATGTYNVLITDANGCTITGIYTLTEPVALSLTSTITNVSVLWGSDGAIDIEVAGGILPYSYA
ncbi:MAG: SprB repeat-containing protein, partial [Bacteroidota bacterium]|nr:SprB repeat-containing protein [Bacteroidota bacterium]